MTDDEVPIAEPTAEPGRRLSLPHRVSASVFMGLVAQASSGIAALVITPVLLHHLGRSAFGVWVLASTVIGYLSLFQVGFGGAAVRLIAEDANSRHDRALRTLNTSIAALVPFGILVLGLGLIIALFSPSLFRISPDLKGQAIVVFSLLAIGLAISIPADMIGGTLSGFQRWDLLSTSNAALALVTSAVSAGVVLDHGGLVPLAASFSAVSISFHVLRWGMVRHVFPEARLRPRYVDRSRLRETARLSGWFLVDDVAFTILSVADLVVVDLLFGSRVTAVYAIGFKLTQVAYGARGTFTATLFPHAAAIARNEGPDALRAVVEDGTRIALLASFAPALILATLASPGIRAWVGPGYETSAHILLVLVAAFAAGSTVSPMRMILYGAGRVRTLALVETTNVLCNLGLSVLFGHLIGPVGVAVGTVAGMVLVSLPATLVMGTRLVGITPGRLFRVSVAPHLLPAAVTAGMLLALRYAIGSSLFGIGAVALGAVVVYGLTYLRFGATPAERTEFLAFVRRDRP